MKAAAPNRPKVFWECTADDDDELQAASVTHRWWGVAKKKRSSFHHHVIRPLKDRSLMLPKEANGLEQLLSQPAEATKEEDDDATSFKRHGGSRRKPKEDLINQVLRGEPDKMTTRPRPRPPTSLLAAAAAASVKNSLGPNIIEDDIATDIEEVYGSFVGFITS